MKKVLFIFRRDLRLEDNTGLLFALNHADTVIPCFIFTPEQIEHNPYRSERALQFMIESLEDLNEQIQAKKGKLYLFFDSPEKIVSDCITTIGIDGVIVNRDYTPYSLKRDLQIAATCQKHQVPFHAFEDLLLHNPEETLKSDRTPYTIFTPYFRNASKLKVTDPICNRQTNYFHGPIPFAKNPTLYQQIVPQKKPQAKGGRSECLKILSQIQSFSSYKIERDFPAIAGTTHLSPHLKFTTCSSREVYHAICTQLGPDSDLIRSLYWRDFFTGIALFFPHVFKGAFQSKFDKLHWSQEKKIFQKWCVGETGFPIVDAGMRQLNQTGYMHNRVRMIVASFLVKDLHLDWKCGEKYFAQHLLDYDPSVNNGNWQWAASTGCDAQPYFRIFNPWNQQKKFDPDCVYIKKWIPQLSKFSSSIIHEWYIPKQYNQTNAYPPPLIDHKLEAKKALEAYCFLK